MKEPEALRAVDALTKGRPQWVPVLAAALTVAERAQPYGGEFAGAWVLDELEHRTGKPTWLPNLRVLLSYGFLEKVGESTRGGRRAYYRCLNAQAIGRALTRLAPAGGHGERPPARPPRKFQFVGAGNSGEPGTDVAPRRGQVTDPPPAGR